MHELILLLIETSVSTLLGETVTDSAPAEIITDAVSDKMRNTNDRYNEAQQPL